MHIGTGYRVARYQLLHAQKMSNKVRATISGTCCTYPMHTYNSVVAICIANTGAGTLPIANFPKQHRVESHTIGRNPTEELTYKFKPCTGTGVTIVLVFISIPGPMNTIVPAQSPIANRYPRLQ
jgi:hypothetical protein